MPLMMNQSSSFESMNTKATKKVGKGSKKKSWKKPKDMPKRPLSAYNLFFQEERGKLLSQERLGFAALARNISQKWKKLEASDRTKYDEEAAIEKRRYKLELQKWNESRRAKTSQDFAKAAQVAAQIQANATQQQFIGTFNSFSPYETYSVDQSALQMRHDDHTPINFNMMENVLSFDGLPLGGASISGLEYSTTQDDIDVEAKYNMFQMDNKILNASMNALVCSLDDECLDFLTQM